MLSRKPNETLKPWDNEISHEPSLSIAMPGHTTWIDPTDPQRGQASLFPVPLNARGTNSSAAEAIVVKKVAVAATVATTTTRIVRAKPLPLVRPSIVRTCLVLGEHVDLFVATENFLIGHHRCAKVWEPFIVECLGSVRRLRGV